MKQLEFTQIYLQPPPKLGVGDVIALDLELSGLKHHQLHRPHGRFVSLAGCFDGENVYLIEDEEQVQEFLDNIKDATWIFHNSVFDIGHLRRWAKVDERKNMRDTLLIERLMFSGYYENFGLSDLVRRYLKCYMPKDVRKEFHEHGGRMTQEQIEYAALDVIGTWLVDREQQKIIDPHDMKLWNGLYNPHVWTALDLGGFYLSKECWTELTQYYQGIVDKISVDLGQKYGTTVTKSKGRGKAKQDVEEFIPYNPASIPQTKAILLSKGIEVEGTDEKTLVHYADNEFVRDLLEFRKAKKQVSTYGLDFLENVESDSRIYTSMNIGLAETGRDSSSSPNLQNIPSDKARRKCFTAGAGKVLCLYDYSGQEANLWAHFSGDDQIAEIINSGKKLYLEVARLAFHEEITKEHPRYKKIKSMVLGLFYGLTPYGLAKNEDMSVEEAEEMFDAFFRAFPKSADYVKRMQSKNPGFVKSVLGRKIHIHPYDRQWKNNALNGPMQGCIGGDSLILSQHHGLYPIRKLNGRSISVWDGHSFVSARVAYSGKKQKVIVTLYNGQKIICSPDHKFSTFNSYGSKIWRSAEELSMLRGKIWIEMSDATGDFQSSIRMIPSKFTKSKIGNAHRESLHTLNPYELGVWSGRVASDGSLPNGESITLLVAEHEKEILDYMVTLTSSIFPPRVRANKKAEKYAPVYSITLDHKQLSSWLVKEGIKSRIPDFVMEDKECLRGYLRGMFDGDGTVNKDGAYLTFGKGGNHYYDWAKQITIALSLFGISARINQCRDKINVRILKRDMPIFCTEIGFINSKKQLKAEMVSPVPNWGNIYGRSIAVKSVEITNEWIDMYDVVDSDTEQFMVDGVVTHNSGSDMIKLAMKKLRTHPFYVENHPKGKLDLILQVHDEIVTEVDLDIAEEWSTIMKQTMIEVAEALHPGIKGNVSGGLIQSWAQKD